MKKITFKTLLVAVGLMGSMSVWAEVGDITTNADIDFSNAIKDGAVSGTKNSMTISGSNSFITDGYLYLVDETGTVVIPEGERAGSKDIVTVSFKKGWGNKNKMGSGFRLKDSSGEYIANFQMARWDGGSTNTNTLNIDMTGLYGSAYNYAPILDRYTTFTITFNYATKTITSVVSCTNPSASKTFTASLTNTNPIATFEAFGYGVGSDTGRTDMFDNLLITTTEGDYTVSTDDYTVNWVCDGTTVKTETRTADVGSTIALLDSDDDSFFVDETKYMYVSDNVDGKTVVEGGTTVVTITVRKPALYNYTVKAIDASENVLSVLASSSVYEDDNSATTSLPWYILYNGKLYYQNKNSNTTSITSDGQQINITYAENKNDIVYYSEAENISGGIGISHANSSNGQAARALSSVKFTTLEAGKYKIYSRFVVGNGTAGDTYSKNPFNVGETTLVFDVPAKTNTDYTSEEFIVTESTDIYVTFAGSSISGVDYIYIQKTGDYGTTTLNAAGYATFSYTSATTISGATAYVASVDEENQTVTLTAVTNNVVPANTGVVLKGEANAEVTYTTTTTDATYTNDLKPAVTAIARPEGNIYVLSGNTFNPLAASVESLTANKAYLVMSNSFSVSEAKLRMVFANDVTAISAISGNDSEAVAGYYTIGGAKVNSLQKGINIVKMADGSVKKVFVK